jgi:glycosyltransferase involved in cell wall biosynthesis
MVARLDPIKDHATLIDAIASVRAAHPDGRIELRLLGDGPLRQSIEELAGKHGVSDNVRMMGARADVPEQLGLMDLFVLATTREEGFGVALIEALAAGVPVIASDVPACREVLQDGKHGLLVQAHNSAALGESIESAWTARDLPPASAADVDARYGAQSMAVRYLAALFEAAPVTWAPDLMSGVRLGRREP